MTDIIFSLPSFSSTLSLHAPLLESSDSLFLTRVAFVSNQAHIGLDAYILSSSLSHKLSHSHFHILQLSSNDSNSVVASSSFHPPTLNLLQWYADQPVASSQSSEQGMKGTVTVIILLALLLFFLVLACVFVSISIYLIRRYYPSPLIALQGTELSTEEQSSMFSSSYISAASKSAFDSSSLSSLHHNV